MQITGQQKKELMRVARTSIEDAVMGKNPGKERDLSFHPHDKIGVFVTIYRRKALRGCIGYLPGIVELKRGLVDAAVNAAQNDPRFPPMSSDELPEIEIEISLLSPLKVINGIDEIEVGRDGLFIEKDYRRGLLLPKVAVEHGWDTRKFLEQTCLKAGLPGNAWREPDTLIQVFTSEVISEKDVPGYRE